MSRATALELTEVPDVLEAADSCPSVSYFGLTAFTPARCSSEYSSIEACPIESTKRSRSGQIGCSGSNRRWRCQSAYATGAMAMGVPGCPELACWMASIASVRMVLMLRVSTSVVVSMRSSAAVPGYF
jgi:hypothetical protein